VVRDAVGSRTTNIPGVPQYSGLTSYQFNTKDELTQEQSARAGGYLSTNGRTPLDLARESGDAETIAVLSRAVNRSRTPAVSPAPRLSAG
jgi:hypothetical protein